MAFTAPSGNVSGFNDVLSWTNGSVNNFFIPGLLMAFFFIIGIKLLFGNNEIAKSFAAASFVIMILSVLFRLIDLVSTRFMVTFIIFTGIGIVWMHIENSRGGF